MYRVHPNVGIGNLFMQISQLDDKTPVSSTIYSGFRDKYLKFKNLNIVDDDGTKEATLIPDCYINRYYIQFHRKVKEKMEPTEETLKWIEKYEHLLDGVKVGLAIRFGVEGPNKICDDYAKNIFENIIQNTDGNVFVACDILDYKLELEKKFGPKVRFLGNESVITNTINTSDHPDPYIEFFLLSKCPFLYLTGGPKNFTLLSTFGYMAAIYGEKPFEIVWNEK